MSCQHDLSVGANPCSNAVVRRIFLDARSQNGWLDRPIAEDVLKEIWDLAKWAPTSANCSPMRVKLVKTDAARRRLLKFVDPGNHDKVATAPVTAILANDLAFFDQFETLFPHNPSVRKWFAGPENQQKAETTALRNGSLQAAFFMMAARSLGLDCGPLSGFDSAGVDGAFWAGTQIKTNFLCSLGYGDPSKLFPRHPRFAFEDVCEIL